MHSIRTTLLLLCLAATAHAQQPAGGGEIKVGGIFDLTGITSDVGKSFAQGVRDAVQWTNENGGVNGKKIRLIDVDYGYNAYGKAPIEAGRRYAKEIGVDLVDEEIVPGTFQDATSQLLNMKQKGANYAYINVTTTGCSTVLRDAKKLGLATKFGSNPYGFSEALPQVAKEAAEGVTGVVP